MMYNTTLTTYDNGSATTVPLYCQGGSGGTATIWCDDDRSRTTAKVIRFAAKVWASAYDDAYSGTPCTLTYPTSAASSTCTAFYKWGWGDGNTWADCEYHPVKYPTPKILTPKERLKELLQTRHAPVILGTRKPLVVPTDIREIRARETLRRVIGDDKFQKFLKDGFITVRAKSGLSYQIFPAHGITAVYRDGVQVERLCVVLIGGFPPTDSLIMRYLIILNDENRFRGYAIKHQVFTKTPKVVISDERSLNEIFNEFKGRKVA